MNGRSRLSWEKLGGGGTEAETDAEEEEKAGPDIRSRIAEAS